MPYLRHKSWQLLREETVPAVRWVVNSRFHVCAGLTPRPMTVVFGLGMRVCVRMCTTLEIGILCNIQQLDKAVNSLLTTVNL